MILKNGKRIDGCSDTVPIGSINPYLGTTPPFGYLLLDGSYVSKVTYPELYAICGTTFGPETDTEFKLPDLRGATIAGYKEGDSLFGTLGGLIGSITKSYTPAGTNSGGAVSDISYTPAGKNTGTAITMNAVELTHSGGAVGNHTLTTSEIPKHKHGIRVDWNDWSTPNVRGASGSGLLLGVDQGTNTSEAGGGGAHNHPFTQPSKHSFTPTTKSVTQPTFTGTAATLKHTVTQPTFTGTTSDINVVQPTITLNWIVKAVMLIPVQASVVNTAISSTTNVYCTDYINNNIYTKEQSDNRYYTKEQSDNRYYTKAEIDALLANYLPLTGGTINGNINVTGNYQVNGTPVIWEEEE